MADITRILGGAFTPPAEKREKPVIDQIEDAFVKAGLPIPDHIQVDGHLHRYSSNGKRGDTAGWFIFYPDNIVCGAFGCWREGRTETFVQNIGRELSAFEQMANAKRISEAKRLREIEQHKKHEKAADTVTSIWSQAGNASNEHPYLLKKGVDSHGIKITGDGRLIIPMFNQSGELASLQYISADGDKKFHAGGEVKGCFHAIGSKTATIYVAEGYATAASIYQATEQKTYVSFSASNVVNVAKHVRDTYGQTANIVIVGDNDESGTGQRFANEAGQAIGARVVIPPIVGDANDYAKNHSLADLLQPEQSDWLIAADDFSSQPSPIAWLIKRWLQRDALIMVHGPSGGGKTFTVLDMALHIASHKSEWRGLKCHGGNVVYLAGEGHHGLRGRIAAWKHKHKMNKLDMWLSKAGCDLNKADGLQRVTDAIDQLPEKPALIIVDTLHRFLAGDENSAQDAKTMLDACGYIMQRYSCSVLLVHHTGVSDEAQHRARGSSAWRGALDIEISVRPGDTMEIIQRKSKDAELAQNIYGQLETITIPGWIDEDGEPVKSAVFIEAAAPDESKKESKTAEMMKLFERCWFASGAETDAKNRPYITRSAMVEALVAAGFKESTAQNFTKPSFERGLIYALTIANMIEKLDHGFVVIDPSYASSLMIKAG